MHLFASSFKSDFSYMYEAAVNISIDSALRGPAAIAELLVIIYHYRRLLILYRLSADGEKEFL